MRYFKSVLLFLCLIILVIPAFASDKIIPPHNKEAVKKLNDLLVKYFKDNCKGENYNANCPILKQLTPNGEFNKTVAKNYASNYHFFVFNNDWIWVGHGLFQKVIGRNHEDFKGADGKYFAQGFKKFVDTKQEGYYAYVEPAAFGGYKNLAYLHRLVFKDGGELIFGTCYNVPRNLIDKPLLKDLENENN